MSTTAFRVFDIEWEAADVYPPQEVILHLPRWLTSVGHEEFEPEGFTDDFTDDDWDAYEPSPEAEAAFEAEWDGVIRGMLQSMFGAPVRTVGGYEPK